MKPQLSLGIVSDEISLDLDEALRYAKLWGITSLEIRCLKSGRIPDVSDEELGTLKKAVKDGQITVTALSPGIFKSSLSEKERIRSELDDILPRTIRMAKELGAGIVIVFGFKKDPAGSPRDPGSDFDLAVHLMKKAASVAERGGVTLAVENEPGCWCDTGVNTARLLRAAGSEFLRANWDPCNAFGTGEVPFPDGYRALKEFIANVHVKDTLSNALISCVPVGEGVIDWRGQIAALLKECIVDHVTIETHCLPLIEKSRQNVGTLREYMKELSAKAGS